MCLCGREKQKIRESETGVNVVPGSANLVGSKFVNTSFEAKLMLVHCTEVKWSGKGYLMLCLGLCFVPQSTPGSLQAPHQTDMSQRAGRYHPGQQLYLYCV